MVKQILAFAKKESILCISLVIALVSMALVPVDAQYIGYIDFHTLIILFSLMVIMAGLRELDVFTLIGRWMLNKTRSVRSIALVLVLLCFVFSMVITNDVALITFVPFTIEVLAMAGLEQYLIRVLVLQTIASNLGSMLTPIGNPQNLYLFSISQMTVGEFIALMLPYTLVSLLGLVLACLLLIRKAAPLTDVQNESGIAKPNRKKTAVFLLLFLFALTSVARVVPAYVVLAVVLVVALAMDGRILQKPDYALLLTFVFLFIFVGNFKRIPEIHAWLHSTIRGKEVPLSILTSQVISNVPAAILLSGFTDHIPALIVGTNLGGLGTIIASMASLISFKFYGATRGKNNAAYLGVFTLWNLLFLGLLLLLYYGMTMV